MLQCGGFHSLNAQLGFFRHCQTKKRSIKTLRITKQKPKKLLIKIEKKTIARFALAPLENFANPFTFCIFSQKWHTLLSV